MRLCYADDGGGWVDCCDAVSGSEARGRGGEDAAAAADVEVGEVWMRGWCCWWEACVDEVLAERVHEVEEAGGAVRVPPRGGEACEVCCFCGGDGGGGGGVLVVGGVEGSLGWCYFWFLGRLMATTVCTGQPSTALHLCLRSVPLCCLPPSLSD